MYMLDTKTLADNIENAAEYDFENNKVFGSAYGVIREGTTVYKKYFGFTSPDGKKPTDGGTLYRIASMTKPITAFAVLILIDRGMLSLDDPISRFFPEFGDILLAGGGRPAKEMTVLHLLTHTSGFGSDIGKVALMTDEDKLTIFNEIRFHLNQGLDFEPGSKEAYSGIAAFDLLAAVVEKLTRTDYMSFLKRELFGPCGMIDTSFTPSPDQWSRIIEMHDKVDGVSMTVKMNKNCVFGDYPCTHCLGGAGLASSLDDYMRFAGLLLDRGSPIISEKTFELMPKPYFPKSSKGQFWGLGVRVTDGDCPTLPSGCFGWSGAYGSHFWVDPGNGIAAVFMKNSLFDGGSGNESGLNFEKAVYASFK